MLHNLIGFRSKHAYRDVLLRVPRLLPLVRWSKVIVGPVDESGPWYFSLNNRRLWVLKRCREEGLLENNLIRVRIRVPKSGAEAERYTLVKCALEAKFVREKDPQTTCTDREIQSGSDDRPAEVGSAESEESGCFPAVPTEVQEKRVAARDEFLIESNGEEDDESDSDESSLTLAYSNPFSALA